MADIKLKLETEIGNSKQVLTSLEKKVEKLGNKLDAASKKGSRGSKRMGADIARAGMQFAKTALLAGGIGTALAAGVSHAKELRMESERAAIAAEKSGKRLQIQAGLTDLQTEKAQKKIAAIAAKTGFTPEAVERVATETTSQGFIRPLETGTVESIIAFMQSTLQGPESDIELLVKGLARQQTGQGKPLTGKALLPTLKRIGGLFFETPLQTPQLADISKAASVTKQVNLTEEDFLSAAVILLRKLPASEAATGLKNTVLRLGAPEDTGIEALERIGLKKEEVDLIGETLPAALKKLNAAIQALPEEQRLPALKDIFGQKVLVSAQILAGGAEEGLFEKFAKLQKNDERFQAAVKVARKGVGPGIEKIKSETAELQRKGILTGDITEAEALEFQKLRLQRDLAGKSQFEQFLISAGESILVGPVRQAGQLRNVLPEDARKEILRRRESDFSLENLEEKMNENNQLMREQNDILKGKKVIQRNAQRE
jgi:hypothetical protein